MKMQRVNMYAAVLGFFLAAIAPVAMADERLFFFGNSYSQFHNGLDWIVKNLMEEASPNAIIETGRSVPNGASLSRHIQELDGTRGETFARQSLITGDNTSWDLVVLQDQSTIPAFIFSDLWYQSVEAGVDIHELIQPTGAVTMFIETWGRQGALDDFFTDYTKMQRYLTKGMREYQKAANNPQSFVAPAGRAFHLVYDDTIAAGGTYESPPFRDLYMPSDGSHPSWEGSYLTSLVIYAAYTGLSVADLEWVPGGISPERRDYLKSIADKAAFEDDTFYPSLAQDRLYGDYPQKPKPIPVADPTPVADVAQTTPSPTVKPSVAPTVYPSAGPSLSPSASPTTSPSAAPSVGPSVVPSVSPSAKPSAFPSAAPTASPSAVPSVSPSAVPSASPSGAPSVVPSLVPSVSPSAVPSESTVPLSESDQPLVQDQEGLTPGPAGAPSVASSGSPSAAPTGRPSLVPSVSPSLVPSVSPSALPSAVPLSERVQSTVPEGTTSIPSGAPSEVPSGTPSASPSVDPSISPSAAPTTSPSAAPSVVPSVVPSVSPSAKPSISPSAAPTPSPSGAPSVVPSVSPSAMLSVFPSASPSGVPEAFSSEKTVLSKGGTMEDSPDGGKTVIGGGGTIVMNKDTSPTPSMSQRLVAESSEPSAAAPRTFGTVGMLLLAATVWVVSW